MVPVSAHSLTCQLYLVLVLLNDLAQAEVCDFYFTIVEDYILRLQIVVNNLLLLVIEVLEAGQNLRNNQLCLFLLYLLVLLQIVVQVRATTQFKNRAEAVVIDLNCVVVLDHPSIIQLFVDFVLP